MKKAIVTGASGFLGKALVQELIEQGVEVIAVVRNEASSRQLKNYNTQVLVCPLDNYNNLPSLITDKDIDVFYHFAWEGTSGSDRGNVKLQLGNIQGTCDAVHAASKIGCNKFIFAGSIMEYEAIQYVPEDYSTPGIGYIYSTAKQTADFMAKTIANSLKLPYVTAIISNIYGVGERSTRLINTTIHKLINKEHMSFTHGEQLYDFLYITDAVRAFYLIGKNGKAFTSYYIGNPVPHPLNEFIVSIRNIVSKDIELHFGEIPFNGALLNYTEFDTTKLYREFNFTPAVPFEEGIQKTLNWILSMDKEQL